MPIEKANLFDKDNEPLTARGPSKDQLRIIGRISERRGDCVAHRAPSGVAANDFQAYKAGGLTENGKQNPGGFGRKEQETEVDYRTRKV